MTAAMHPVNGGLAQIRNVAVCFEGLKRVTDRNRNLPGMVVFYGPSGFGKSMSANYVAVRTQAYYVQTKSSWTRKHFLEQVLAEMRITPEKTVARMVDQVGEQLAKSGRTLIVDEFDHMATDGRVELVRDIYEASQGSLLLIGEEMLPRKLERWERFHGRVLCWMPAQPVSMADARELAPIYCPRVSVADDVLKELVDLSRGSVRRVCNNLDGLHELAMENGLQAVSLEEIRRFGHRLVSGDTPAPRKY